jgi:nitrogen fixation protein NifU and related proteins
LHEFTHVSGSALAPRSIVRRPEDSTSGYGLGPQDLGAWRQRRQPFAERRSAAREQKVAGDVSEFDQMYREVILDHYKNPRGHGMLDGADAHAEGQNPLCGDEVSIYVAFGEDGETIDEVKFSGRGCAISQAATSMLMEMVQGKTAVTVATLDKQELLDEIGIPLTPVRLKCAMLGLTTLKVALHKAKGTPLPEGLAGFDELELT